VELTEDERVQLVAWARRSKSANAVAMRSRIVLAAADGLGNTAVAAKLGVQVGTARKWRNRFLAQRLEGVLDEPRPGRPRTVVDEQVEAVITRTLETTPKDATHWSTRSLAVELGMSQSAVSRIWRASADVMATNAETDRRTIGPPASRSATLADQSTAGADRASAFDQPQRNQLRR
jgi:transposase